MSHVQTYHLYLSMRFNWRAFKTPPAPMIGTVVENLVFANLVMQGTLYTQERLVRTLARLSQEGA